MDGEVSMSSRTSQLHHALEVAKGVGIDAHNAGVSML